MPTKCCAIMSKKSVFEQKITAELKNKSLLITGGAGSIGSALVKKILEYPVKSVRILDINEHSLFKLKRELDDKRVRYLLGNILNHDRIEMACSNVDIVIHCAAIKNIEISEFNPIETIETNVDGVVNLIKMCMTQKPKKFLNISTDKAADSSTLYGTTKLLGEKLTSWAGNHIMSTKFATLRFGNVIETSGNVFEVWRSELKNNQPLSITNTKSERFFFHSDEAVNFILKCLLITKNGELYVPKMKSYKIKDLANEYSKKHKIIGLRQGEKLKETLITESEKINAVEKNDMWIIKSYKPV